MEQKLKTLVKKLVLPSVGVAISLAGLILLSPSQDEKKINWSKSMAEISSYDGRIKTYINRDGSRSYVTKVSYNCNDKTFGNGFTIVTDRDNDWLPEKKMVVTGCGNGWIDTYENRKGFPFLKDREYF